MSGFWHVSLLIDLDCEWWWPRPVAFTETPSYFPRRAGVLVHESIHYWQQLSQGYLLALADEDWRLLLESEQGGRPALGPLRERYRQPDGHHRFSPHDLCETIARFWEVLFVGPDLVLRNALTEARRKSISGSVPPILEELANQTRVDSRMLNVAMDVSGVYSAPFAVVREVVGDLNALAVFPFLVHFALKTMRPVYYFERFLNDVAPAVADKAAALGIGSAWTQDLTTDVFPFARERCEQLVRREGDGDLLDAAAVFAAGSLAGNSAYAWAFDRWNRLAEQTGGHLVLDCAVCLPAFVDFRQLLARRLAPPCIRFRDRQTLGLYEQYSAAGDAKSADDVSAAVTARSSCLSLQERWEAAQQRLLRH